jgi:hypothetical protein
MEAKAQLVATIHLFTFLRHFPLIDWCFSVRMWLSGLPSGEVLASQSTVAAFCWLHQLPERLARSASHVSLESDSCS